ncbi:MAG: MFS transporter [Actinomycetota bacterium]|nr:MFS transporter [Actinomycetota bacterium]
MFVLRQDSLSREALCGGAAVDRQPRGRYRRALRSRDLRLLVSAFLTDQAASWSYSVVLIAYVYGRTGSTAWITAMASSRWIVGMLIAGYAGVLADRYDRAKLLVGSAALSGVVAVGLAAMVALDAPLPALVGLSAVLTVVSAPTRPASGALVPEVVAESELTAANGIFVFLESLIVVIGPGVGGLLLLTGEPVYGVLLNAASYAVSGSLYARLRVRSRGGAGRDGNAWTQWRAGLSSLAAHRKALVLTLFLTLDSAAIGGASILNAPLSVHLGGGTTGYSVLIAAGACGGVIAAGLAHKLAGSGRLAWVIMASIGLECVPLYLSVYSRVLIAACVLQLASGVGMVIVDVLAFTALQRDLPRHTLGRVLSTVDAMILAGTVFASFLASGIYSAFGLAWALAVCGLGFPALALLGLPAILAVDRRASAEVIRLRPNIELLEGLDLFTGAAQPTIEQLASSAERQLVPAGRTIIRQGDAADALWILVRGRLHVVMDADGRGQPLGQVEAPGYVGEIGLLHGVPRSATVVAAVASELLRIAGEDFLAALETAPASSSMLSLAGERLSRSTSPTPAAIA